MSFSLFVHLLAARLASRLSIRRRTPRTQVLSTQALVTRQSSAVLAIQLQSAQRAEKETLHPNTDQRANEALHISTMTTLYMAAAPSGSHPVWPPGQKETTAENTCSLESIMPRERDTSPQHTATRVRRRQQIKHLFLGEHYAYVKNNHGCTLRLQCVATRTPAKNIW